MTSSDRPGRGRAVPDSPGYWEALARRIEEAARGRAWVAGRVSSADWLAVRSRALVAAAVAVVAVALILSRGVAFDDGRSTASEGWFRALGPDDAVGRALDAATTAPPAIGVLVLSREPAARP
jgi:hypothetical protein